MNQNGMRFTSILSLSHEVSVASFSSSTTFDFKFTHPIKVCIDEFNTVLQNCDAAYRVDNDGEVFALIPKISLMGVQNALKKRSLQNDLGNVYTHLQTGIDLRHSRSAADGYRNSIKESISAV